jgi:hypothetical protein
LFGSIGKSALIRREVFLNECADGRTEPATPVYFRLTLGIIAFRLILLELRRFWRVQPREVCQNNLTHKLLILDGGQGRNRTADASLFRAALYRLSYLAVVPLDHNDCTIPICRVFYFAARFFFGFVKRP